MRYFPRRPELYYRRSCARFPLFSILLVLVQVQLSMPLGAAPTDAARELQQSFVQVAKNLKESVVNIRVERTQPHGGILWQSPFPGDPDDREGPLNDFFRDFFQRMKPFRRNAPQQRFKTEAAGSGVIFDAQGIILTNNHVVKGASAISVKLLDGSELAAEIVGQDPQSDLAVIKVSPGKPLKAAIFGDSDQVEVGQWCIAVGNPLGLEQTVTVGVVSAVGRSGIGATTIEDFIQTDASINPGNSGGPLVDIDGKVIGINTLIFAAPGSGIGFAIPSKMARRVAEQLVEHGSVARPFIGISMQAVTSELAEHFSLPDKSGAVILSLADDGPAQKAGLKPMDIIVSIDGHPVKSTNDVQKYILSKEIGAKLSIEVLRNGAPVKVTIKLEEMPKTYGLTDPDDAFSPTPKKEPKSNLVDRLGFSFRVLTPETAKIMHADRTSGLLVTQVRSGSLAEEGGLERQDVITQVNGVEVKDEASLTKALSSAKDKKSSVLVVIRSGNPLFLVIPHEEK